MKLSDSRRLTGPNVLWNKAGAVADLAFTPEQWAVSELVETVAKVWQLEARRLLDAVGWKNESTTYTQFGDGKGGGGLSLAISAPLDALYCATELNEWAVEAAYTRLQGVQPVGFEEAVQRVRGLISQESNPPLLALRDAALKHGVAFLSDDDYASVGMGTGSQSWPVGELPAPDSVDWAEIHDIPTAMITGTNGKSTTARLLAAMVTAAGKTPGVSSTDWVRVGDETLDEGDWSGPGGARLLLRDQRVEFGILETARGGLMRRGLALESCDVGVVLNVGTDHLDDWGTSTHEELGLCKFTVPRIAKRVVLNVDDPLVVELAGRLLRADQEIAWFGLDPENTTLRSHLDDGGTAAILSSDTLVLCQGEQRHELLLAADAPVTLKGVAQHNIANALATICIADSLGLSVDSMRDGLRSFASDPKDNPGRLNRFNLNGATVLIDFAHNPEGMRAAIGVARALDANRRLVLLGQAGDRDVESVNQMCRAVWDGKPDMVVIKELTEHLRGRELGEMPAILEAGLRLAGAPEGAWCHADSEIAGVRMALEWAQPGDLLLLVIHDMREQVLELVEGLEQSGWKPGQAVPA